MASSGWTDEETEYITKVTKEKTTTGSHLKVRQDEVLQDLEKWLLKKNLPQRHSWKLFLLLPATGSMSAQSTVSCN